MRGGDSGMCTVCRAKIETAVVLVILVVVQECVCWLSLFAKREALRAQIPRGRGPTSSGVRSQKLKKG